MPFIDQSLTIVVPTLWKVDFFPKSIMSLAESNIVSRIIIIDNNPAQAVHLPHPKIDILSKGSNIYVNPAWNLGVRYSSSRFTCLLNDDLDVTDKLLEYAISVLDDDCEEIIGLIGMGWGADDKIPCHRIVDNLSYGFGTAMFFRTKDYLPIPSPLKILCGDDYLVLRLQLQGKKIVEIAGFGHLDNDEFSKTINSDREHFNPIMSRDLKLWRWVYRILLLLRHRQVSTISKKIRSKIVKIFSA